MNEFVGKVGTVCDMKETVKTAIIRFKGKGGQRFCWDGDNPPIAPGQQVKVAGVKYIVSIENKWVPVDDPDGRTVRDAFISAVEAVA